jgi:hypothetical protein
MRRFPLHALRACTCAALLVGCKSAVELVPQPPPPPPQSLSFEIAGPSRIDVSGPFLWEAFPSGGSGAYQYKWEVTRLAGQVPTTTTETTERALSLLVAARDGDMFLTVAVTSGKERRVQRFGVRNCISGCGARP